MESSVERDEFIGFRVGADERRVAVALARVERVRLSEALRLALREAAQRRGLWPLPTQPAQTGEGGRA